MPATRAEGLIAQAMGKEVKRPLIFECVGTPGMIQSLAEAAPPGTRIVVAGVCMETRPHRAAGLHHQGDRAAGSCSATRRDEFAKSLENLAEGRTRYNEIITGVVGLDATPDAFVNLQTDKSQIKILVAPGR